MAQRSAFPFGSTDAAFSREQGNSAGPDQGILAFWINSFLRDAPLRFVGYGGRGQQARDFLHPKDLARLVWQQLCEPNRNVPRIINVSGGTERTRSLLQIHQWCEARFGRKRAVKGEDAVRTYDVPWLVLDSALAAEHWSWRPLIPSIRSPRKSRSTPKGIQIG
jgi:CDP-paratose 2-epimerase